MNAQHEASKKVIELKHLVLYVLYRLQKKSKKIKEHDIHKVLIELRDFSSTPFNFIKNPTHYVSQLDIILHSLEKMYFVSETIIIHNEAVPKYYYELTKPGLIYVEGWISKNEIISPFLIENLKERINHILR